MKMRSGVYAILAVCLLAVAPLALAVTNAQIVDVDLSEFPRVNLLVSADASGLPLSAFSATDNGDPVTLIPECFDARERPVDIVFVIDVSRSMEDNIRAVADGISDFVAFLEVTRPGLDFDFGLVTYGQDTDPNAAQACPSSTGLYYGGPRNRTIGGLMSTEEIVNALNNIACPGQDPPNCLAGGNEPAYHAIYCAANSTPWRVNSERKVVLISDENNDWAMGTNGTCNNDAIPFFSLATVNANLIANGAKFFGWVNDVIVCDGHDNGDGILPENLPCGILDDEGCVSGWSDFNPVATGTGGATIVLSQPAEDLFEAITFDLLTSYTLCYDVICCVPNVLHTIVVTVNDNGVASDDAQYTTTEGMCPPSGNPTIYCDPTNPAEFTPGDPVTLCFIATDADGIDHVSISWIVFGGACGGNTVNGVLSGPNRYCVTISGACTENGTGIAVDATAYDECGNTSGAECPVLPPTDTGCYDLADLPPPYPTHGIESGGPSHHIIPGGEVAYLGTGVDCEPGCCDDGGGEDNGFTPDCEGQLGWSDCQEINIPVTVNVGPAYTGETLYLSAWYDHDGNGQFDDLYVCFGDIAYPEWIIRDEVVTPGVNNFAVVVTNANAGYVNLRFRLSTSPFGANGYEGTAPNGEVEDYNFYCPPSQECCRLCVAVPPIGLGAMEIVGQHSDMQLVLFKQNGQLRLRWNHVANAAYYQVYRGNPNEALTTMNLVATVPGIDNEWVQTGVAPATAVYFVQPYELAPKVLCDDADRAQWEFNEGIGETTEDHSGNGHLATRWADCPPAWGYEEVEECNIGFSHFEGVHPDGCPEHFRVPNADIFYEDRFQVWACVRLANEPTVETGPYYIVSNNSFDINGGGFALRVDPGWYIDGGGVRQYHNRLTMFVWNSEANGGAGGWNTLQSPAPTALQPTRYSVPVGVWSTVCAVVDGNQSMLIIDGQVVAVGVMEYHSQNNNAPLIIGAGYRHSTYPIEYPWYGDIDCLRITSICDPE